MPNYNSQALSTHWSNFLSRVLNVEFKKGHKISEFNEPNNNDNVFAQEGIAFCLNVFCPRGFRLLQ